MQTFAGQPHASSGGGHAHNHAHAHEDHEDLNLHAVWLHTAIDTLGCCIVLFAGESCGALLFSCVRCSHTMNNVWRNVFFMNTVVMNIVGCIDFVMNAVVMNAIGCIVVVMNTVFMNTVRCIDFDSAGQFRASFCFMQLATMLHLPLCFDKTFALAI